MVPNTPGIYKITCTSTGKVYVGSSVNTYRRWYARHLPSLRKNRHYNTYLQHAWNKYGEAGFVYSVIEPCDKGTLLEREQFWIDTLRATNKHYGFNLALKAGSTLGVPQSEKARAAIVKAKAKSFIVRDPVGVETTITNLSRFCALHNLTSTAMNKIAVGKQRHHKGWECRHANTPREEWLTKTAHLPAPRPKKVAQSLVWCSKCRNYKQAADFNRDNHTASGLAAYCRECNRRRRKAQYRAGRAG